MTNEQIVKRYADALTHWDYDTLSSLRHPEWTSVWPQSGEVVRTPKTIGISRWAIPVARHH